MPAPVYFLLHVPKTAGQTLSWHLQQHAHEAFVDVDTVGGEARLRLRKKLEAVQAISGHKLSKTSEAVFAGRELRRAVLLRDPADLILSLYNFRMLSYRAKGLGTYSFDLHLRALPRNFVCDFILGGWLGVTPQARRLMSDRAMFARVSAELATFHFVGAHTRVGELAAAVSADLGIPRDAERRNTEAEWLDQVAWTPLRRADLTAAQIARIAEDHPADQALFETWAGAGFEPGEVAAPAWAGGGPARPLRPDVLWEGLRLFHRDWAKPAYLGQAKLVARGDRARGWEVWDLAVVFYGFAVRRAPHSPALWLQYARALRALGHFMLADEAYRRAIALKPDFRAAAEELAGLANFPRPIRAELE